MKQAISKYGDALIKTLNSKIRKGSAEECWPWDGTKNDYGYGEIYRKVGGKIKILKAHRVAHEAFVGEIPDGMFVLHRCDNPPCCNPDHLFIGTRQDNADDMVNKGRSAHQFGEQNGFSKLTEQEVKEIRASAEPTKDLMPKYEVSRSCINRVRAGTQWAYLDAALGEGK